MGISRLRDKFRSMKVEVDALYQGDASAGHSNLYTVTDYSGNGILKRVNEYNAESAGCCYFTITIDNGTTEIIDCDSVTNQSNIMAGYYTTDAYLDLYAEFSRSLLVKIANDYGLATKNISGICCYAHLSNEIRREIIQANQPLPDRDYTYPFDVLVVHYATGGSSIKFLSSPMPKTWFDGEGKLQGKIVKPEYNLLALGRAGVDYNPEAPKFLESDWDEDGTVDLVLEDLDGYPGSRIFTVPIVKGVIDSQYLPVKPSAVIKDATKIIVG